MSQIQDAVGSATCAIRDGFIYGGMARLYISTAYKLHASKDKMPPIEYYILKKFNESFFNILLITYKTLTENISTKEEIINEKAISKYNDLYFNEYSYIDPKTLDISIIENNKKKL